MPERDKDIILNRVGNPLLNNLIYDNSKHNDSKHDRLASGLIREI